MSDLIRRNKLIERCKGTPALEKVLDGLISIIEEQPPVEAVPVVHLDIEKSEILDALDKMQFFLGQRAGRELWKDKPVEVQEKDLENFNRDIRMIKDYLFNVKPVVRGEWQHRSYGFVICSECGNIIERLRQTEFCSNCGADMRRKV